MKLVREMGNAVKMSINEWEMDWAAGLGQTPNVRPQCDDYEYQFEVGDLVKMAPGFYQQALVPGDLGVVTKRIVMYCSQVKTDGPGYKIAWQKQNAKPTTMREFKLVPARKQK